MSADRPGNTSGIRLAHLAPSASLLAPDVAAPNSTPANCSLLPAVSSVEAVPGTVLYNRPTSAN
jgi:hypothetical protein